MLAKIEPGFFTCKMCMDVADSCGCLPDCDDCVHKKVVEVISTHASFFGAYAIVKDGENLKKISVENLKILEVSSNGDKVKTEP